MASLISQSDLSLGTNPNDLAPGANGLDDIDMSLVFGPECSDCEVDFSDPNFTLNIPSPSWLQPQSRLNQDSSAADSARLRLANTDCSQHISNAEPPGCGSGALLDDLCFGIQKVGLAHAADGKQEKLVITVPPELEAPANPHRTPSRSSPISPMATSSVLAPPVSTTDGHPQRPTVVKPRRKKDQKLEEYVSSQLRQAEITGAVSPIYDAQILPTIHQNFSPPSTNSKYQTTLRKLHLGMTSSFVVNVIKTALWAHKSSAPPKADVHSCSPSNTASSSYHFYKAITLRRKRAQNSIEALHHTYELYRSFSEGFISEYKDGFVHSDQQKEAQATVSKKRKRSGNPLKKLMTQLYNDMIAVLEPDLDRKTEKEQEDMKRNVQKLRSLGSRLDTLVRRFGGGVLCLIPFPNSDVDSESAVAITEAESVLIQPLSIHCG